MARDKKRICLALSNVGAEDAIIRVINEEYPQDYEIAENVRSKEALVSALGREKFDALILREDLTGNIDLIELFKMIRQDNNDLQIIFFMNNRENGDPFYVEMFLFNIYDFVVLPDIKLDDIFSFLRKPRRFKDILRFLPARPERIHNLVVEATNELKQPIKLDKNGDVDEVFTVRVPKKRPPERPYPDSRLNPYSQPGYAPAMPRPTVPSQPTTPIQSTQPMPAQPQVQQNPVTQPVQTPQPQVQNPAPAPAEQTVKEEKKEDTAIKDVRIPMVKTSEFPPIKNESATTSPAQENSVAPKKIEIMTSVDEEVDDA